MWIKRFLLVLAVLTVGPIFTVQAATLPDDFSESLIVPLDSLNRPTNFAIAPDGRVFITLQGDAAHGGGAVLIYDDDTGTLLPDPLIVVPTNYVNEHGLLGITFDPDFETNGYLYLYYTTVANPPTNSVHRISRFTVTGNTASLASELVLLETGPIGTAEWHHGGEMQFGPDGMMYIGFGDNLNRPRSTNATSLPHNAQELDTLFGKIARIDPRDGPDPNNLPDQLIPSDNPFIGSTTGSPNNQAIYARGVRHPYKIDYRPTDGKMLFIEVGNNSWEEINELASGANYGWPQTEGDFDPGLPANAGFTRPVYFYSHGGPAADNGCAITAGSFYNPPVEMFPSSYVGKFFFAEYCNAWMKTYDPDTDTATSFAPSTEDNVIGIEFSQVDGSMYYLVRNRPGGPGVPSDNDTGHIYHVIYTPPQPPVFTVHPQDQTISLTQVATFSCSASGNPQPTIQWQRNGVDIPGATGISYTTPAATLGDNGDQFRCVAANTVATATSNAATLTVLNNLPPVPTITLPKAGTLYSAGHTISFKGKATDPEDGALPAKAFTWSVAFQHDTHAHPFLPPKSGKKSGSFTPSTASHGETNVWYRIYLTVKDSAGASTTTYLDVHPRLANITVQTSPPGLTFNFDSLPHAAAYSLDEVVGVKHNLSAPLVQTLGGNLYVFSHWSDGKPAVHNIATPGSDRVYTAIYKLTDLKNGSFETVRRKHVPTMWRAAGFKAGDGQVCDQASSGPCSFTLTGGARAKSLTQILQMRGAAGDDLSLGFAVHTAGASGFVIRLTLYQADGGTQSQSFALTGDMPWQTQALNLVASEKYKRLRVRIIASPGSVGQVWLDAMHLDKNN